MPHLDHLMAYGQSLSIGTANGAAVLTAASPDPTNVFRLTNGPRVRADGANELALDPATLTTLPALIERMDGATLGETICSGMAYWLKANAPAVTKLLASTHGRGGYQISLLANGTQPYANMKAAYTKAKTLVNAAGGTTYSIRALPFMQGESDEAALTAGAWAAAVEQLRADVQGEAFALTGQAGALPMFITQFSSFWYWLRLFNATVPQIPSMPQVMLDVHEANPLIRLVGPNYIYLPTIDKGHITSAMYRWQGELIGRAIKEYVYDGTGWECLRPISLVRLGTVITVELTGNVGDIVFDLATVADDPAKGFICTVDGVQIPVVGVDVAGPSTLQVMLGKNTPGVTKLYHAIPLGCPGIFGNGLGIAAGPADGPRGFVRDSIAPASVFGNPPLYKWLVHFVKTCTGSA